MLPLEVPSNARQLLRAQFFPPDRGYDPKAFIPHAASLRQAFAHCAIFPTAASRRSLGRVPVPVWLVILSDQLPIVALVGLYPANKLMGRGLIHTREHMQRPPFPIIFTMSVSGISDRFQPLFQTYG